MIYSNACGKGKKYQKLQTTTKTSVTIKKAAGKKLYYLTNFSSPAFERTLERFPFFEAFDGGVVSSHERIVKPMPAIYRLLCRRYGFSPKDALFIDDNPENTKAAQQEGFAVWTLRGEDIE